MSEIQSLELQVRDDSAQAIQGLNNLVSALKRIKTALSVGTDGMSGIASQYASMRQSLSESISSENIASVERMANALRDLKSASRGSFAPSDISAAGQSGIPGFQQSDTTVNVRQRETAEAISQVGNAASGASGGLNEYAGALRNVSDSSILGTTASAIRDIASAGTSIGKALVKFNVSAVRGLATAARKGAAAFNELREKVSLSNTGLGKLISSIQRVAMYRLIRSAIKQVTDGVKTGVDNLYQWSAAMGGSFAQSMDTGSAASLKFKNSIGAMLAPAIQAVIPLLVSLANAAITAANAINQIFAVLSGASVWTRATDAVNDYTKAAGGAGSATKNLLADWDELNIIQSSGGGGGGGASSAYSNMFATEELPVNEWTEMAAKIRAAVEAGDSVGTVIAEKMNSLIDRMKLDEWAGRLNRWIRNGLTAAVSLLSKTDFALLGQKFGAFLYGIFGADNTVNWELAGSLLRLRITAAVQTLQGLFTTEGLFEGIGTSFAALVNSFFQLDPVSVGKTIAAGINNAVVTARTFISTVQFAEIGKKVGALLDSVFKKDGGVNWRGIGTTLKEGLLSAFEGLSGFLRGGGGNLFADIATAAAETVNSFFEMDESQKSMITDTLNKSVKDAIDGVTRFFTETDWEKIGKDVRYWIENIDWKGIANALWRQIGEIFTAAGTLVDYIALGIHNSIANAINSSDIATAILGHQELLADPETLNRWMQTGSYEGMRRDENGYLTVKPAIDVTDISDIADAAKQYNVSQEQILFDLQSGEQKYVQAAEETKQAIEQLYEYPIGPQMQFSDVAEDIDAFKESLSELETGAEETEYSFIEIMQGIKDTAADVGEEDIAPPDNGDFISAWIDAANAAAQSARRILAATASVNGASINPSALRVSTRSITQFAAGGFPQTGSLFIAREAGPEMVGSIGGKTAVANNDQIVAGVANGVAAGQAEQNALLRQQNDYLRQLLNKESTVQLVASPELGRINKRSEEMRLRAAGV